MTEKTSCSVVTKEEKEKFDQMFRIARELRDHSVLHYTELDDKLKTWIDTVEEIFEKYYNNGDSKLTYRQLWIVNNMVSMIYATSKTTTVEEMFPLLPMGCMLLYCNCEREADFKTFRELLHDLFEAWYFICNGHGVKKSAEKWIMSWEEMAEAQKLPEIEHQIAYRLFCFLCSDEVKTMARSISAKDAKNCEMKIDFDCITPSLSHDDTEFRKCYLWFLSQDIMSIDDDGNVAFEHLEKIPKMVSDSADADTLLKTYLEMEIWVSMLQKAKEKISVKKEKTAATKETALVLQEKKEENAIVVCDPSKQDAVLSLLDTLMEGKSGKAATMVIMAAIRAGVIMPNITYGQFCARYGTKLISRSSFYKFVGPTKDVFLPKETAPIEGKFKNL